MWGRFLDVEWAFGTVAEAIFFSVNVARDVSGSSGKKMQGEKA